MSVTFTIKGSGPLFDEEGNETGEPYVDFSNANGRRVILQLQLPGGDESQPCGSIRGKELREACERYLANIDPSLERAKPAVIEGNFIECGQPQDSFSRRVSSLLELARKAGDLGIITYG
jgi:hypothetical protein